MTWKSTTWNATVRVANGQSTAKKSDKSDEYSPLVVGLAAKSGETVGCLTARKKTFARNYARRYS